MERGGPMKLQETERERLLEGGAGEIGGGGSRPRTALKRIGSVLLKLAVRRLAVRMPPLRQLILSRDRFESVIEAAQAADAA